MSGLGIPQDRMVVAIINPTTGLPISPVILRKYFRPELDEGMLTADMTAMGNLLKMTARSAAAGIFWAKVRLHFKEAAPAPPPPDPSTLDRESIGYLEVARRIYFTLSRGAASTPAKAPLVQKEKPA